MLLLGACQGEPDSGAPAGNIPGGDSQPYSGIAPYERLHFTGTEPFWGGEAAGDRLTYSTPENQAGEVVAVERFAGRGGISFSGTLGGESLVMTVTPSQCSDGMSDRTYPYAVTLRIGNETRNGCGWTDSHPFEGPSAP